MNNYSYDLTESEIAIKLINKCEEENGLLIIKPSKNVIVHFCTRFKFNILNIQNTTTTIIYDSNKRGNLKFYEYVYIELAYKIQEIIYKAEHTDSLNFELLDYISRLCNINDKISEIYNIDIEKIYMKM